MAENLRDQTPVANSTRLTRKVLLLGLGNDLLKDDAIGLRIVDAARESLADCKAITILKSTEMGLALLDLMVGFDDLIIVDAVQTGQATPGAIHRLEGSDLKLIPAVAPHFLGIGEVLALGRELGLVLPDRIRIFAIEVQAPFTVSPCLSHALETMLPRLVETVVRETRQAIFG